VLHQVGGRSHVTFLFYRRQGWPHYVCGGGRGGDVGLLGHLFYLCLSRDPVPGRWRPGFRFDSAGRALAQFCDLGTCGADEFLVGVRVPA
jgi:hypothetical protein